MTGLAGLAGSGLASAQAVGTIDVTSDDDSGAGTFREAVDNANGSPAINTIYSQLAAGSTVTLTWGSGRINLTTLTPLTITGGAPFTVFGDNDIVLSLTGGVDLTVDSMVSISATGNDYGIRGENGNNSIAMAGRIELGTGGPASGIYTAGGANLIDVSGSIETESTFARGIYTRGGSDLIDVSGIVETQGDGADGIAVVGGNSEVNLSGSIVTNGGIASGIIAGDGSNVIENSGSIVTAGNDAYGILAVFGGNEINISGSIETRGRLAYGVNVNGGGDVIDLSGGIVTEGDDAYGIRAIAGNNEIAVSGSIETGGTSAYGINAQGGDNVIDLSGSIHTEGSQSRGISASGENNSINVSGNIETAGDLAYGIYVPDSDNKIDVSGGIQTWGSDALGMGVFGSDNEVILSGSVSANDADAIRFGGAGNRLELRPDYAITGNVLGGTDGTLTLGGGGTGSFNVGDIGAGLQFRNFASFDKRGTSTWTLTGVNTATDWDIQAGTLLVNGTVGNIDVMPGGTLGGAGTVGTTTIGSGGTIAPGNSIGTLTVDGDLTLSSGSTYEVEVDPTGTASDLITVLGTAYLNGGSVVHIGEDGNYRPEADYTILTATGGVAGEFDGVTSNYVFLDPTLNHGLNDVILRLERNQVAFSTFGETQNQKQTAEGLDSLDFSNPAYQALTLLSAQQDIPPALDRLSGEIHASGKSGRILRSARLRSIISQRIRSAFSSGQDQGSSSSTLSSYVPVASAAPFDGMEASSGGPRYTAWAQGFGQRGQIGGDGNAAGLSHDDVGILVGSEVTSGDRWHAGVFGGYSRSQERAADRFSSAHSDDYHFGIHGGADLGMVLLSAGAAHSWHSIASTRNVAFGGFIDTLTASYDARTAQFFGEASLPLALGGLDVEPFAALAHVHLWTEGFGESGGAAALTAQASSLSTTFSTLGLRASHEFALGDVQARARAMIGWQHAFGTTTPSQNFSFAGGSMFSIAGTPIDRHAALLEVGLDLATSARSSLGLSYEGRFAQRGHEHGVNARLNVSF